MTAALFSQHKPCPNLCSTRTKPRVIHTPISAPSSTGSYSLNLDRIPRQLSDMEWDTLCHATDVELSTNCLTACKNTSAGPSTVRGTCMYSGNGCHEFHVILDNLGPDGVWVGMAPADMDSTKCVGDAACGWALHTDGDKRCGGREEEFAGEREQQRECRRWCWSLAQHRSAFSACIHTYLCFRAKKVHLVVTMW